MSLVLVILGIMLVGAGLILVIVNKANDSAGGSGFKTFTIEGPAWLVLVCIGVVSTGWGVIRWEDRNPPKTRSTEITAPPDFTLQDEILLPDIYDLGDDETLDGYWLDCSFGDWAACDSLFLESPVDSEYEWFGATCGYLLEFPEGYCSDLAADG